MSASVQKSPSVGSIIKKIVEINPELGVMDVSKIIRQSIEVQSEPAGEFSGLEIVNEMKALGLARASVRNVEKAGRNIK